MTTRSEFIVEEVIGWAARGAEMPGKIKEWYEVLRLVRLGQLADQQAATPALCTCPFEHDGECTQGGYPDRGTPEIEVGAMIADYERNLAHAKRLLAEARGTPAPETECACPDAYQGVHVSPTCPVMGRGTPALCVCEGRCVCGHCVREEDETTSEVGKQS